MTQGDLPEIFGLDWRPDSPLEFFQSLPKDAARSEVLTFIAQRHDAHLFLVANVWDHVIGSEPETFEGPSWDCLLYTSPSPRDGLLSRMPSSA